MYMKLIFIGMFNYTLNFILPMGLTSFIIGFSKFCLVISSQTEKSFNI